MDSAQLDDKISAQIEKLSEQGNALVDQDDYAAALEKFEEGLALLPEPKAKYDPALWLYASIGDMHLFQEDYQSAADNFYHALNSPYGEDDSFILLRLGEALYELGEEKDAVEKLLRAYLIDGKEIFEDEDEKYFEFLKANVDSID